MKNRNTILITILSALACLAFLPETQAIEPAATVPDPPLAGGNTADGQNALLSITTGLYNTAIGFDSLLSLTDTSFNTGVGAGTLLLNTGTENTAAGAGALLSNTTGSANTAVGTFALFNNIGGGPTSGNNNTAVGDRTLLSNNTGNFNTAVGAGALGNNTTGSVNVAIGHALSNNTSGGSNVAIGGNAGLNADTGDHNVYIGQGMVGVAGESDSCYIRSIFARPVEPVSGVFVVVDSNGKLGTLLSSRRFKHDIKPMDKASEAILALKPVTFHYKSDAKGTPQFGLIAEDVQAVNPNLVVRDKNGELLTVRYEQVNAMLLNEFLKEHKKVQNLEVTVAQQQKGMEVLTAQLKEQAAQIQKVSAQVQMAKPATKVAVGNQ
jgi:Chaperone of endosialidase